MSEPCHKTFGNAPAPMVRRRPWPRAPACTRPAAGAGRAEVQCSGSPMQRQPGAPVRLAAALRYSRALYALEPLPETDRSAAPPPPKAALYGLDEAAVLAASPLPSEGATGRHVVQLLLGSPGELPATAGPDAALHREAFQRMLDGRRCWACLATGGQKGMTREREQWSVLNA